MAIYHATTKPISRKSGRTATASSAYRAGQKLVDERTGKTHDYTKKGGVLLATAFDKDNNELDRSELWNLAEKSEKRKDARTAREWIVAIPSELMPEYPKPLTEQEEESIELVTDYKLRKEFAENNAKEFAGTQTALDFGKMLSEKYGVAVDVAIHAPDSEGSNKNYHAHIMTTTREFSIENGQMVLGDKTNIELSNKKLNELKLPKTQDQVKEVRKSWADIVNHHLEKAGLEERIDHRSYKEMGVDKKPTIKMGYKATDMERAGKETDRGDINRAIKKDNETIKSLKLEIYIDKGRLSAQNKIDEMKKDREEELMKEIEQRRQQAKEVKEVSPNQERPLSIMEKRELWKQQQAQQQQEQQKQTEPKNPEPEPKKRSRGLTR